MIKFNIINMSALVSDKVPPPPIFNIITSNLDMKYEPIVVSGDLLDCKEDCIFGQYNCITTNSIGLALETSKKYPYADIYSHRRPYGYSNKCIIEDADNPGTCKIVGPSPNQQGPYVACLFGQYNPGKPKSGDTYENRKCWFKDSLSDFLVKAKDLKVKKLGFPYKIGCGYAGGKWEDYLTMINEFAKSNQNYDIKIYKL